MRSVGRASQPGPTEVHAYLLKSPLKLLASGSEFDIHARPRRVPAASGRWIVIAVGGEHSRRPLHSLAVSMGTDEVVYHDRRNAQLKLERRPIDRGEAVAAARFRSRRRRILQAPNTRPPKEVTWIQCQTREARGTRSCNAAAIAEGARPLSFALAS